MAGNIVEIKLGVHRWTLDLDQERCFNEDNKVIKRQGLQLLKAFVEKGPTIPFVQLTGLVWPLTKGTVSMDAVRTAITALNKKLGGKFIEPQGQKTFRLMATFQKVADPNSSPVAIDPNVTLHGLAAPNSSRMATIHKPSRKRSTRTPPAVSKEDLARLRFAIELAQAAGNRAMNFYSVQFSSTDSWNDRLWLNKRRDPRKNYSTEADEAANNEIVARIKAHSEYRGETLISEEGALQTEAVRQEGYTWVVDPLDGTGNFDSGIPFFCTAIGGLRNGQPHLGVVFDPVRNELFYALDGQKAALRDFARGLTYPITTSPSGGVLQPPTLAIHISTREAVAKRLVDSGILMNVSRYAGQLRALGSSQLALAYVACGRLHGFLQLETWLWDQVAGIVLVRSAGGSVSDLATKGRWTSLTRDVLATQNEALRDELLKLWPQTTETDS